MERLPPTPPHYVDAHEHERMMSEAQMLNDREMRNIEINSNGVWLLNYQPCTKCGGQLMYGGRVDDESKIFCPRCGTRFKEVE